MLGGGDGWRWGGVGVVLRGTLFDILVRSVAAILGRKRPRNATHTAPPNIVPTSDKANLRLSRRLKPGIMFTSRVSPQAGSVSHQCNDHTVAIGRGTLLIYDHAVAM